MTEENRTPVAGCVRIAKDATVGRLLIDSPSRMNAMSFSMWGDLLRGVEELAADDAIRVIIVAGAGSRAFCAGGDISEFDTLRSGAEGMRSYDAAGKAAMSALRNVAKPTVAMIHGYCLGGGLALALQCDLRYASHSSRFGIPAAKRGVAYDFAGTEHLVGLVGPAAAKEILFTARQYSGREACEIGLVNRTVPDEDLARTVEDVATAMARNAPLSIRASKLMIAAAMLPAHQRDPDSYVAAEQLCLNSRDYEEATRSFMEKREAIFTGQ